MRSLVFLFIIQFSFCAYAADSLLVFYPVNFDLRYERGASQNLEARRATSYSVALHRPEHYSYLLEYAEFSDLTGNETSSIERKHQEVLFWTRYNFREKNDEDKRRLLYVGGSLGAYSESIKTRLMGQSRTDKLPFKIMGGAAVGIEVIFKHTESYHFALGAEARALLATDFDPNPILGAMIRLGFYWAK